MAEDCMSPYTANTPNEQLQRYKASNYTHDVLCIGLLHVYVAPHVPGVWRSVSQIITRWEFPGRQVL